MANFDVDDGEMINCIRQFPSIYDKNHGDYRNKQAKMNAWKSIGQLLGVPEEVCEQRWVVLRNRYATELRNKKKYPSGTPSAGAWRLSQAMSFLEEYIAPRRTRGSLLMQKNKKNSAPQDVKPEVKPIHPATSSATHIVPETLVAVELRSSSPSSATRLRPIAPRPSVPAVARFVSISNPNETGSSTFKHAERGKEVHESEDEDILFGKSIGHSLKNIKSKKMKLQIKSEILAIIAKHSD